MLIIMAFVSDFYRYNACLQYFTHSDMNIGLDIGI